ncbi:MAG TPA: DUF2760 domain-containing protein [Candidatus Ozemobacteraceae bacterium]|nr:DUF2760 domain-containing protein [Candidatus Ozemobacteraceae bacterium]
MFKKLLALVSLAGTAGIVYGGSRLMPVLGDPAKLEEMLKSCGQQGCCPNTIGIGIGIYLVATALLALIVLFSSSASVEPVAKAEPKPEPKHEPAPEPKPEPKPEPVAAKPVVPAEPAVPPVAYQILALFQKEGRLLDFLMEDIAEVDDESLGGAIRPIHEGCRNILRDRLVIEPVLSDAEGDTVNLGEKVDPNAVKLTGNVAPTGPYSGVLVHRGWRMKECKLPSLVSGWTGDVIAPAEVEIS